MRVSTLGVRKSGNEFELEGAMKLLSLRFKALQPANASPTPFLLNHTVRAARTAAIFSLRSVSPPLIIAKAAMSKPISAAVKTTQSTVTAASSLFRNWRNVIREYPFILSTNYSKLVTKNFGETVFDYFKFSSGNLVDKNQ